MNPTILTTAIALLTTLDLLAQGVPPTAAGGQPRKAGDEEQPGRILPDPATSPAPQNKPVVARKAKLTQRRGAEAALNPQPLPPKEINVKKADRAGRNADGVALNPQPLPPVDGSRHQQDHVALNPQPLPPKEVNKRGREVIRQPLNRGIAIENAPIGDGGARRSFPLSDGTRARIVGRNLMLSKEGAEVKASPGRYKTRSGRVLVVNSKGELSQ